MSNFLDKLTSLNFSGLFGKKNDSFLGVDIGSSYIKVVQLKKNKGVVVLETYGELSLGPYANVEAGRATKLKPADISEALSNLIKESNVTVKKCGASIALRSSLVFVMKLPATDQKQLEQMIPIEARKYIPVPVSEVDLDWKIIPKDEAQEVAFSGNGNGKQSKKDTNIVEVLVVAIHKDMVNTKREIVTNAGLDLSFLEIEVFSTIRAVSGSGSLGFAILDMGSGATKLYIVEKGIVKDSHIIGRGSQDVTLNVSRSLGISVDDSEKKKIEIGLTGQSEEDKKVSDVVGLNLEQIFLEANKVIVDYQRSNNKNISKLVITGGGAVIKGMSDFAKEHLTVEDVSVADPFSKVETPAFLDDLLKEVGPGFAVALGLAIRGLREMD